MSWYISIPVERLTRLHLHFQAPDRVFDSDPRVRVLVDVSPFPGLVGSPIWPHSHFQAFGRGTNSEPGARDKECLWMCLRPPGNKSVFIFFIFNIEKCIEI